MDMYREHLLDHYRRPRGWGLKPGATAERREFNPLCGDEVTAQLFLAGDTIEEARFEGHGCVICLAAASLLSEDLVNASVERLLNLGTADMNRLLGITVPPRRVSCARLALTALQAAARSR